MSENKENPLKVREATHADLPQLLELEQRLLEYERPFNAALKLENAHYYDLPFLIEDDESLLIVVETDGEIIGTGYVQLRVSKSSRVHPTHGYLGFMYVSPAHRGQGINQTVMRRLIEWSTARRVTDFYLDVYAQNEAAIRAYQKAGFEPIMVEMKLSL